MKACVLQAELSGEIHDVAGLVGYERAHVLLRFDGRVVGEVIVPIEQGLMFGSDVRLAALRDEAIRERMSELIVEHHLMTGDPETEGPSWTIVVCTRDRTEMLEGCLDSLVKIDTPRGEIVVVDNASTSDATRQLVMRYPGVRYVREDRVGLNRARMTGAEQATGEVVVYADDDTIAEPDWVSAILSQFREARVGAVTGLTMPYELETEAQEQFELYGGFRRGFRARLFDFGSIAPAGAGAAGSGANMAFRRDLILDLALFAPSLDLGTPARTGGDTYALARILSEGYRVAYSPDALNWHRHRTTREDLLRTLEGYGTGLYTFLVKSLVEERDLPALRVGLMWFRRHHLRELVRTLLRRPKHLPLDMIMAEIKGTFAAPYAYIKTRRHEASRPDASVIVEAKVA